MVKMKNNEGFSELATIIGQNGNFEGKLSVKHSVRIDGRMKGEVDTSETVTVGQSGIVEGDIRAKDIIVGGSVDGSITATGKATFEETSKFSGNLKTKKLVVKDGACFNGSSEMTDSQPVLQPKKLPPDKEAI